MNFGANALQVLRTVAPSLALAVGGPFGPIAAAAIHLALGTDPKDPKSAEAALLNATPEQLAALKKADQEFIVKMRELGIQEEQLAYADISDARKMQTSVRDPIVGRLAWTIIGGFIFISFAQLIAMVAWPDAMVKIPPQGWLLVGNISGHLLSESKAASQFFFGTTAGSQAKDATIADIAKSD